MVFDHPTKIIILGKILIPTLNCRVKESSVKKEKKKQQPKTRHGGIYEYDDWKSEKTEWYFESASTSAELEHTLYGLRTSATLNRYIRAPRI